MLNSKRWKGSWSFQNGLSVWFTRLNKSWGRLLIWQLSRRQSLTPSTRRVSHKHSLPKKLYTNMLIESWVEGKSVEEKDAQPTERTAALWEFVKQNRFKNLGELHKEWTEAGVKASRATTHRRVKEFGYSCRQRRLTWAKEKNWTDGPSCLKSSVKFSQSVMIGGAMSSAGVGPLCFLKTNVTAPVYQEMLEHFMLPSTDQHFKDADFIFPAGFWHLPTLPKAPKVG